MADVPGPSKTAWGRAWGKTEKAEEPIVSLVEIMSEELAEQLDGEEKKVVETPRHDESYVSVLILFLKRTLLGATRR